MNPVPTLDFVGKRVVTDIPETVKEPFDFHLRLTDELAHIVLQAREVLGRESMHLIKIDLPTHLAYSDSHRNWPELIGVQIVCVNWTTYLEFQDRTNELVSPPVAWDREHINNLTMSGAVARGDAGEALLTLLLKHQLLPSPADQMINLGRIATHNHLELAECVMRHGSKMLDQFLNQFKPADDRGRHAQQWFSALLREKDLDHSILPAEQLSSAPRARL